jgi:hypothetical protein
MIHGDACFAYFNKIWGIPLSRHCGVLARYGVVSAEELPVKLTVIA